MKIINPNDFLIYPLTVDSAEVSVDSTGYTADQISVESGNLFIKVIPREYPTNVNLKIYKELTKETIEEECIVLNKDGYMSIPFLYKDFTEGDSLELTVYKLDGKQIWRGKAYVTSSDDLQNYKLNVPTDIANRIIKL